jgi:hypothetical protein
MISKELFVKLITSAEKFSAEIDRWSDFGIDLFENNITILPWEIFQYCLDSHFDEDGKDWISWYLWERHGFNSNEVLPCYNEDGTPFYVNTPEDLWDLVALHRLRPCLDTPCSFLTETNDALVCKSRQ